MRGLSDALKAGALGGRIAGLVRPGFCNRQFSARFGR